MKNILYTPACILGLALMLMSGAALAEFPSVPDFKLPTENGEVSNASLANKVIYVDFWASWCKPCKKSFPFLNDLQKRYGKQGLVVLGINLDKDKAQAQRFLQHLPAQFTVAFDPGGVTAQRFHVQGMPSSYLVDRQGHVRARHIGFREQDRERLENAVANLLQE